MGEERVVYCWERERGTEGHECTGIGSEQKRGRVMGKRGPGDGGAGADSGKTWEPTGRERAVGNWQHETRRILVRVRVRANSQARGEDVASSDMWAGSWSAGLVERGLRGQGPLVSPSPSRAMRGRPCSCIYSQVLVHDDVLQYICALPSGRLGQPRGA